MNRNTGFSLIELMVVVAIIGILSAVAVPAYSNYVLRSKIAEAASALSDMRVRMEQYYQDNRAYVDATGACGVAMPTAPAVKYFTVTCVGTAGINGTYTLTATGNASGDTSMANFTYTVNQQNAKTSTITQAGWTGNAACWATKQDGSC